MGWVTICMGALYVQTGNLQLGLLAWMPLRDCLWVQGPVLRVVALLPLMMAVVQLFCLHKPPSQ